MALTRAKAQCLGDALNVTLVAVEELDSDDRGVSRTRAPLITATAGVTSLKETRMSH